MSKLITCTLIFLILTFVVDITISESCSNCSLLDEAPDFTGTRLAKKCYIEKYLYRRNAEIANTEDSKEKENML